MHGETMKIKNMFGLFVFTRGFVHAYTESCIF